VKQSEIFFQTKKVIGEELFHSLKKGFIGTPKDFPEHLKLFLPDLENRYSFVPELAQMEYILSLKNVPTDENSPVKNCENVFLMYKDNQGKKLSLNPNLKLLKCRYPVWEIYQVLKNSKGIPNLIEFDLQPKIKNKYCYVIDNLKNGPFVHNVSPKVYTLLEGILLGHSFGKIAEELFSQLGANEFKNTLQKILSNNWVA
jgi:hypothetical protein